MDFGKNTTVDLEKAFNTVNHKNLLAKLDHNGVRSLGNVWFRSYLSNRKQMVDLGSSASSFKDVTCTPRLNHRNLTFTFIYQ